MIKNGVRERLAVAYASFVADRGRQPGTVRLSLADLEEAAQELEAAAGEMTHLFGLAIERGAEDEKLRVF